MASVLGPTLEDLRPAARALGPSLRETRPFLIDDDADHPRRAAPVHPRGAADGAASCGPRCATWRPPRRTSRAASASSTRCSTRSPTTRPAATRRATSSGSRGRTTSARRCSPRRTRTARSATASSSSNCDTAELLETVAGTNPALGTLVDLLNAPTSAGDLPAARGRRRHEQGRPVLRPDRRDGRVRAVVLRPAAVPVARLRRPDPAQAAGLPLPDLVRRGHRSSPPRPTCGSPACPSAA